MLKIYYCAHTSLCFLTTTNTWGWGLLCNFHNIRCKLAWFSCQSVDAHLPVEGSGAGGPREVQS